MFFQPRNLNLGARYYPELQLQHRNYMYGNRIKTAQQLQLNPQFQIIDISQVGNTLTLIPMIE